MPKRIRGFTTQRYINPRYLYLYMLLSTCLSVKSVSTKHKVALETCLCSVDHLVSGACILAGVCMFVRSAESEPLEVQTCNLADV